jgi:hypothetical protein
MPPRSSATLADARVWPTAGRSWVGVVGHLAANDATWANTGVPVANVGGR